MKIIVRSLALFALIAMPLALAQSAPTYPGSPTVTFTKAVGGTLTWSWGATTHNTDGSAVTGTITYELFESAGPAGAAFASVAVTQSLTLAHTVAKAETLCGYVIAIEGGTFTPASGATPASIVGGLDSAASNMDCGAVEAPPSSPPGFTGS